MSIILEEVCTEVQGHLGANADLMVLRMPLLPVVMLDFRIWGAVKD